MNLRAALALLLLWPGFWPNAGVAETIGVRSGEHADFSRLLLQFKAPQEWSFGRVDGGFEFRAAREEVTFGLDRVFDLIPRRRVQDVRDLGDGRLFIAVDCDCHVDAFALARGQVVLDFKSGPPPSTPSPFEARLKAPDGGSPEGSAGLASLRRPDPASLRAGLPLFIAAGAVAEPSATTDDASDDAAQTVPPVSLPAPPAGESSAAIATPDHGPDHGSEQGVDQTANQTANRIADPAAGTDPVASARTGRVAETESALLGQLARAASQGLLEADLADFEARVDDARSPAVTPDPPPKVERRAPLPPVTERGHIAIETSIDRAFADFPRAGRTTQDGTICVKDDLVAVETWGAPLDEGTSLGEFRSRIVGEFDISDGQGITDLTRHYVYITFGAEAKALIQHYPDDVVRGDLLYAMADIVDHGVAPDAAEALADQMSCDGAIALWAALAQSELPRGEALNRAAVVRSFSALPPHLRGHVGPGLAEKLLASGDKDTAMTIRAAIARAVETETPSVEMLDAQFEAEAGEVQMAQARLDDVIDDASDVLPQALLDRAELALSRGEALPDKLVALLNSVAFEQGGTPLEGPLRDAEIRALTLTPDFDAAFTQLESDSALASLPKDRREVLRETIFESLAQAGSDESFLVLTMAKIDAAASLSAPSRRLIAERFLELGFARPARRVLGGEGQMPERDDRFLYARAALLEDRPDIAIGYLAGLESDAAQALRAQALFQARDHEGAARTYAQIGDAPAELRAAWLGGLWPTVADLDQTAQGAAARLMAGLPPAVQDGEEASTDAAQEPADTPIAQGRALLEASRAARDTVKALLDQTGAPALEAGS